MLQVRDSDPFCCKFLAKTDFLICTCSHWPLSSRCAVQHEMVFHFHCVPAALLGRFLPNLGPCTNTAPFFCTARKSAQGLCVLRAQTCRPSTLTTMLKQPFCSLWCGYGGFPPRKTKPDEAIGEDPRSELQGSSGSPRRDAAGDGSEGHSPRRCKAAPAAAAIQVSSPGAQPKTWDAGVFSPQGGCCRSRPKPAA